MPLTASKIAACTMADARACAGTDGVGFRNAASRVAFQSVTTSADAPHVIMTESRIRARNRRPLATAAPGVEIVSMTFVFFMFTSLETKKRAERGHAPHGPVGPFGSVPLGESRRF